MYVEVHLLKNTPFISIQGDYYGGNIVNIILMSDCSDMATSELLPEDIDL